MSDIYVHHNPGRVKFNAYLLALMRSWYMPTDKGANLEPDTWLRLPAVKSSDGRYVCVNCDVETSASVLVADDTGLVLRVNKTKPMKEIPQQLLNEIRAKALDVSDWEYTNRQPWPYNKMFNKELISHRFSRSHGGSSGPFFESSPGDSTFKALRRAVGPKPCASCGRKRLFGR